MWISTSVERLSASLESSTKLTNTHTKGVLVLNAVGIIGGCELPIVLDLERLQRRAALPAPCLGLYMSLEVFNTSS